MDTTLTVRHISIKLDIPFEEFIDNLEKEAGFFNDAVLAEIEASPHDAEEKINKMAGKENIIIFSSFDRGQLFKAYGFRMKMKHYIIGNSSAAALMTKLVPSAALFTPIQLIVYEAENGEVYAAYNLPILYPGELGLEVAELGLALDIRLKNLIQSSNSISA
ncbi:DUF302 domain-containing protein [Mucilaginibacter aquaedulcis]|uniref:DUF302 domain-containing protein n=1 Tax=Mucilaginibacter aquaedulcis TaxID=1187081 RepID=UPI0025B5A174|nr:DUF302 domain-containing protein [Mucilaginibacter aquaedulcis]MDN3548880.1 DUF302 domain-containing protein [Mucilaginibacter aquaedulcis]